ncbi:hypothetical protein KSP35_15525 [Aquihabitans sp. G128]|uniref:hypothetical protein n=1 Tax=Aquihabitans sp. G128 TaxID=2849779 RepID=UPI001C23B42D|nr:hypothetical protein [Aquihabitans sp. G128]QXC59782.1 hypothetical protein KSP35_15525 [Aquihabitans sp. G128]
MADAQDQAVNLDDDELDGEYPPDHLMGAEAYGEAGAEPGAPESVEKRAAREEPEELPLDPTLTVGEDGVVLAPDDDFSGDPTLRDVVQEREAPIPAEEAALHVVDEGLADFDSEVDDPALEAAWETDPEVER